MVWYEPDNNGAEITSYTIYLRENDLDYSHDLVNCDGTDSQIVSQKGCLIPVAIFKNEPFNHPWGASIFAKVQATNIKGASEISDEGNGAVIIYAPDPPTDVREDT